MIYCLLLLGGQLMSIGFLGQADPRPLRARTSKPYSIAERTDRPKEKAESGR